MSYKTILVHCDSSPTLPQRLRIAAKLAEHFEAHLIGLHVQAPMNLAAFSGGVVPLDSLHVAYERSLDSEREKAAATFAGAVKGVRQSNEWRVARAYHDDELVVQSRYADLLVLGQTDASAMTSTPKDLPEVVAISSGRATLVVPHVGVPAPPGKTVLLCWNASRESARAATEALPFLTAADKVIVLVIDPRTRTRDHGAEPGADVALWLARHGATVAVQRESAVDGDVGQIILSRAADHGADLIVMGLYGHSRLQEVILGGASRTLLSSMTVPVLMAH
jgi:nucleotide-binding universal stress UspA family protein